MNFAKRAEAEVAALLRDIDVCIDSQSTTTTYQRSPGVNNNAQLAGILSAAHDAVSMVCDSDTD